MFGEFLVKRVNKAEKRVSDTKHEFVSGTLKIYERTDDNLLLL